MLELAEKDYAPAQYFQALVHIQKKEFDKAIYWLEKQPVLNHYKQQSFILLSFLYRDYEKDFNKSKLLMEKAVYEHGIELLKPELMSLYFSEKNTDLTLKLGKEIISNYSIYSEYTPMTTINMIIRLMSKKNINPEKILEWFYKLDFYVERKGFHSTDWGKDYKPDMRSAIEKSLSQDQILQVKETVNQEMSSIFMLNDMCYKTVEALN